MVSVSVSLHVWTTCCWKQNIQLCWSHTSTRCMSTEASTCTLQWYLLAFDNYVFLIFNILDMVPFRIGLGVNVTIYCKDFNCKDSDSWRKSLSVMWGITDLQSVNQFLLNGILSSSVGCHTQPLRSLPQSLLLVLIFWICRCALRMNQQDTYTSANIVQTGKGGATGMKVERQMEGQWSWKSLFFFASLKSIIIPEWHISTHHIINLLRRAGILD